MKLLTQLAMTAWLSCGHASAQCDDEQATWESATIDGVRHTLAIKSDDQIVGFIARIEEWRSDKLAWRLQGEILCSNGAVVCRLDVPNMMNPDDPNKGDDDYATAIVERIDADGDGNSEWIALAGLEQELYYSGGASVEFLNRFGREYDGERMLAPNIYKFAGCREASDAPKTGPSDAGRQVAGALYGIPKLCDVYEHEDALIPSILGEQPNVDFRFGTWWMDDQRVVGGQGDCAIVKKNPNGTIDLSCSAWDETWKESRKYSEEGNVRYVGDVELKRCKS